MSRSFLHHESIHSAVLAFLGNLPSGQVTPRVLVKQVNTAIFPELGIVPAQPVLIRTGRQWLIALGWRMSSIKNGIYMDGHERKDVIDYCQNIFLP